jgi:hypothetical protein
MKVGGFCPVLYEIQGRKLSSLRSKKRIEEKDKVADIVGWCTWRNS